MLDTFRNLMSKSAKLNPDEEVWNKLKALPEFSELHDEEWRNQVASDLNHLVGRAIWTIESDGQRIDCEFGMAVLRIVQRVAEFEEIKAKGKPNV
jgi:hypothetical protein